MTANMGGADRLIRVILAIVIVILYLTRAISGIAAIILGIIALILLLTSAVGVCPLYFPLRISTKKGKKDGGGQAAG
jgi:uncharacterized SAM-binding protein YcdF (DUF218 family)